jgi:hypothetical protein
VIETDYKINVIEQELNDPVRTAQGSRYIVTVADVKEGIYVKSIGDDVPIAVDLCFRRLVELMKYR